MSFTLIPMIALLLRSRSSLGTFKGTKASMNCYSSSTPKSPNGKESCWLELSSKFSRLSIGPIKTTPPLLLDFDLSMSWLLLILILRDVSLKDYRNFLLISSVLGLSLSAKFAILSFSFCFCLI